MSPDLNDSDLERELRRRADRARLHNDWARIELLPVVRTAVDSRPQPLAASRLTPLAGIAAVAAVLVLLVVALPRMIPAPGATTEPSPTAHLGPVVLSSQEFATRLTAGELVGSTFLVEGRIGQYEGTVAETACSPLADRTCFMGQLDGIEPLVAVRTRYIATPEGEGRAHGYGPEAWSWWHLPAPPVEGILVLSVHGDGPVEYMGRVKPASDGLTWSASEASEVDLESLALDEIVLVDGWLTGLGGLISGQPPQPGTFIGGLPQRYSGSPTWVLDEAVALDPNGYQEPEGGIRVQNGAYYEFAPNPALVDASLPSLEPRRATYALTRRLEGGGCPGDAPPCLQWNVVGSLTPDSPQDPPATPDSSTVLPSPTTGPPPNPRTITCHPIGPLPGGLGAPSPPQGNPTVIDETGLISFCFISASLPNQDDPPVTVSNSDSDRDQLSVTWLGNPCDIQTAFTFRRSGSSYELTGERPAVDCEQSLVRHRIEISLSQPVPAELVEASVPALVRVPTQGPSIETPVPCMGALTRGLLVPHRQWGIALAVESDGSVLRVVWPHGFAGRWQGAQLVLIDGTGTVLAHVGDKVEFGGGYAGDSWIACTDVNVLTRGADPEPTPEPLPSRTIDCEGAPTGDVAGAMTLVDHAGLVANCSVPGPIDGDPALLPTPGPRVLTFEWTIPCGSDVSSTVLDFWSREDATAGSSLPPYLLVATRSEWKPGSGCLTMISQSVVKVVFSEPIAVEDVEFVLISEERGRDLVEFDSGYFQLTLISEKAEYSAGEPIEIQAELLSDGIGPTLTLSGVTSLVNGFGIEQLDGPLVMGPVWDEPCVRHEMRSAEPLVFPYVKSAGWSEEDPNAAFYQEWVRDPQLRLPAGTWLVTAYSEFAVGSDCAGPQVALEASIVIHVR